MSDLKDILLVHQEHDADKAGLHTDWRVVLGDKAYSWATKKDIPEPGKKIVLHEQPLHDRKYALSERIVIPKGQYGAGTTTLKYAQRGTAEIRPGDLYKLRLNDGQSFTIKKIPSMGAKAWLCINTSGTKSDNKYLDKIAKTKNV